MNQFDLVVLGAGPAGAAAALAAAEAGLRVALIDEQPARAGGQVLSRLTASPVTFLADRRVWSVTGSFRLDMLGPGGGESVQAPRMVAATGAHERLVPFPGWTLPGVIGLAACTALLEAQSTLPGRTVVAGCGPLLASVAAGIVAAGGAVAAVADLAGPRDWLATMPALLRRPSQLRRGLRWMLRLGTARVPVLFRHSVRRAEGEGRVQRVVLAPVDAAGSWRGGTEQTLAVDSLAVGHGFVPGAEIPRLLRAAMRYDRALGGWVPVLDAMGRTSVAGLYAVEDGAGLRGEGPAEIAGLLAGLAAAHDSGRLDAADLSNRTAALAARARHAAFLATAMRGLMALRPGHAAAIPPETVVCRCEGVTRAEIDAAAHDGALELNQLKHFTRCGMGPCQGRWCGDVAAELLAQSLSVTREQVGAWTGRPPLHPVPLADLLGDFRYGDIPIPAPAPL